MPDLQMIRLAFWLQRSWQQAHQRPLPEMDYEWTQLRNRWEAVRRAYQQLELAMDHGLVLCLSDLKRKLAQCMRYLAESAAAMTSVYSQEDSPVLSLRHWWEEITQLHDEFDGVKISRNEGKIRVEIPPLTLRDVYLGPFAIDFRLKDGSPSSGDFEIVALDPQPASTDSELFHPHVKEGELCAGDAKVPLKKAVVDGRLSDAFLMIRATLQTYNQHSAYITLDKWLGVTCSDCSETVDPEDSYTCESCHCTLCSHCISSCSSCSSSRCPGCLSCCADCKADCCPGCLDESESNQSSYCRHCRARCGKCGGLVGKEELDPETQFCPECFEEEDVVESEKEVIVHD